MKIKYEFVDGTISEIEVDDSMSEVIVSIEHDTHNSDRKETRRHTSLNYLEEEGLQFSDETDLLLDVLHKEDTTMVQQAVSQLNPQQQELIRAIYLADKPMSHADYAKVLGIEETSVTQKAWRARESLKRIIETIKK